MEITKEQLLAILPSCGNPTKWSALLNYHLHLHSITEKEQIACFIAQAGHESSHFNAVEENLNYSADGLLRTFLKYFDNNSARNYARNPEKIANRVYANRMGNGPEESGDGWKYRGRGLIQLTGKENYTKCSMGIFNDDRLVVNPIELLIPETALLSALWFWDSHNLSAITDMTKLTRIINGGANGLSEKIEIYNRAMRILD
jgi:putative chitinase